MHRNKFRKRSVLKTVIVLFLALGLTMAFMPRDASACATEDPGFGFGNLLQGFFEGCPAPLAATAVGSFLFIHDFDYDMPASGPASSYSSFGASWAQASTETGEIHLVTQATGLFFDWSAGAIVDKYSLGEGVNPSDVNISVNYDGSLSPGSAFGIALFGSEGFQLFGKIIPGEYDGDWTVSLEDIVGDSSEFCMGFAAFTVAWGEDSSALFGQADFADTFTLSFVTDQGNNVPVESEGGFSQVPIPGTILLFVPGLIGIFTLRKKRS